MFTSSSLLENEMSDVRIGIGCGTDKGYVESSVRAVNGKNVVIYDDPMKMIDDLYSGRLDAVVRGDMASSKLLPFLKEKAGVDSLERLVLLEPLNSKLIFLTPVGIDEGWTVEQKFDMVKRSLDLMRRLGAGQRVAVMSGGRNEDKGRCLSVDKTINDANELVEMLTGAGYDAYNAQILIEDAVDDADLVIAPDGITGNLIFRTLHFIGEAKALGAPVINIEKIFVDTSRVKNNYVDSIMLAQRLTEECK